MIESLLLGNLLPKAIREIQAIWIKIEMAALRVRLEQAAEEKEPK